MVQVMLDGELATYWILPAAFGPAATDERTFFSASVVYLQRCFPWMKIGEVITDISRTHVDGTVRLAREIPYGSPAWEKH
jgi:hypothetical protein